MTAQRRGNEQRVVNGVNGVKKPIQNAEDPKTDYTRWRMVNNHGEQTWEYLTSDEKAKSWPQTDADKWYMGLSIDSPKYPKPKTASEAAANGFRFYSRLQQEPGNWACEYGGPMFLLPGLIVSLYVTNMPLTQPEQTEVIRYIFSMQNLGDKNGGDGGWGLHIEGDSSVFGTAMNYTCLRLLGVSSDDPRMRKARACLYGLGGALNGPHWTKFWLSVLGVMQWPVVNPVPPELWLLPDWVPISPWRWWIHMRQVFLPMGFIWSKEWTYPQADSDPLIRALRQELFTAPHEDIAWRKYRNAISDIDNYHPKSWVLNLINWFLVLIYIPFIRYPGIIRRAEKWAWTLIETEDLNTDYANLGPVNGPMNLLACYIQEGPDARSTRKHRQRMQDFMWMSKGGMMMNGTNGVQSWDTAFTVQATVDAGLADKPEHYQTMLKALEFLDDQQILEHTRGYEQCSAYSDPPTAKTSPDAAYRHPRRGGWAFSNKTQGYAVSDCTAEGLKATLLLQSMKDPKDPSKKLFPELIDEQRLKWAVDIIITMQNANGACSSYEPTRGGEYMEYLNAAEVFGRIMIEYDYPECTTACVTTLHLFHELYPDYRAADIDSFTKRAVQWIRSDQRADGSWYGSWGICFTYAGMFAVWSLATQGETHANSERMRRACQFFLDRQNEDGGWGESYRSCETGRWCQHPDGSQVVNTAWALVALLTAQCPNKEPLERAVQLLMERQQPNGEWLQEGIEGVFNKSCMISYPNYKFIFPIMALGKYEERFGSIATNGHGR